MGKGGSFKLVVKPETSDGPDSMLKLCDYVLAFETPKDFVPSNHDNCRRIASAPLASAQRQAVPIHDRHATLSRAEIGLLYKRAVRAPLLSQLLLQ